MTDSETVAISDQLAARIVRTLAPTLSHNVNIMDRHGVIIASLEADRLGQQHRAAVEVVARGDEVIVVQPDAGSRDRIGVNVPLLIHDRLVGVVGVTGEPVQVAPIARVLAVAVGLLAEQELERDRALAGQTAAREAITLIASPGTDEAAALEALDAVRLRLPVRVSVRCLIDDAHAAPAKPSRKADTVSATVHGALWVLSPAAAPRTASGDPRIREWSYVVHDPAALLARSAELRALLRFPSLLPGVGDIAWDPVLALAAAGMPQRALQRLAADIAPLAPEHALTIGVLWRERSMQAAADALHVHRNTLLQRLDRIAVLTQKDARVPSELAELALALHARRALE